MTAPLASLARATRALSERAARAPVDHVPWLPGQLEFLSHTGPEPVLYRAGNRQGKSTVGCAELIFRARGRHPFKSVPASPVRLAIVCFSMIQSVAIQRVLWDLVGGRDSVDLRPGQDFSSRTGFRGHRPVVEFQNGSEIHVFSNAQGAEALAGNEFSWILLDEPPAQDVYDESRARVRNAGAGSGIGITLTPINGPPLPWLRKLTESDPPLVRDIHVPLTPESQISPVTGLVRRTKGGQAWDAQFIAELRRLENPIDAPIRLDGEWESRSVGQFFRVFDPERHVSREMPSRSMRVALGIDYAAADRELGMAAVLSFIDRTPEGPETIYVVDEVVVPGTTTMEVFASSIRRMLADRSLGWHEVDQVYGDNPVWSRFTTSSNLELQKWIARQVGTPFNHLRPRIKEVKEEGGQSHARRRTKDVRCRWAYNELGADRIRVHPRCKTLVKAMQEWDYGDSHPYKDVLDAWLYGLRPQWEVLRRFGDDAPPTLRF